MRRTPLKTSGSDRTASHNVVFTALARAQFLALVKSALYARRRGETTRAMQQVGQLLAHSPRTIGNSLYDLRAAKLQVYSLSHGSLYIEYGVHDSEQLVIIRFVASFRGQVE